MLERRFLARSDRGGVLMSRGVVWRYARRLKFESLESRRVLATITVTNLNDAVVVAPGSAPGTLRQAVYDANQTPGADTIQFASNLSGSVNLSVVDDTTFGSSALVVSSPITIAGNANGITIARHTEAVETRLFRVTAAGDLTLQSLSLTGGIARGAHASLLDQGGGAGMGGAIYNEGVLQIVSSLLYGNQAIGGNAGAPTALSGIGRGGAVYNDNTIVVTNSTLSGNSTQSGLGVQVGNGSGGALSSKNGATSIRNSTISNNTSSSGRGVFVLVDGNGVATLDIQSSILGQSDTSISKRDLVVATETDNPPITVTGSNNLIRSQSAYDYITISIDDPMLGPLSNNGGPTMTHALAPESPAVNMGNNSQGLDRDQRGGAFSRVIGGATDIGAFELQTVAVPPLPADYNGNSVVDAADYIVWRKTLGTSVPAYTAGDGTGEGEVDQSDFNTWRTAFGATAPGAAALANSSVALAPQGTAGSHRKLAAIPRTAGTIVQSNLVLAIADNRAKAVNDKDQPVAIRTSSGDSNYGAEYITDPLSTDAVFAGWGSS
jgi:hypothetical protein